MDTVIPTKQLQIIIRGKVIIGECSCICGPCLPPRMPNIHLCPITGHFVHKSQGQPHHESPPLPVRPHSAALALKTWSKPSTKHPHFPLLSSFCIFHEAGRGKLTKPATGSVCRLYWAAMDAQCRNYRRECWQEWGQMGEGCVQPGPPHRGLEDSNPTTPIIPTMSRDMCRGGTPGWWTMCSNDNRPFSRPLFWHWYIQTNVSRGTLGKITICNGYSRTE